MQGGENIAKLTEKQKRFCEEYLVDLNATQAALRAGYSKKTAYSMGQRLLKNVEAQKQISELRKQQSERTGITADKVLRELAAIAFSDRTELAKVNERGDVEITPTEELSEEVKKVVSLIKEGKFGTEVYSYDKLKALELIGKHLGMFDAKKDDNSEALNKLDEVLGNIKGGF